jgi:hypothetical protein
MPRNLYSFCPETCTLAPNPALWDTRLLGKPFHTLHPGMEWWKAKHLARWNDAELQSARRRRTLTCRLSHVRESKERHGFRSSKTSPFVPTFIVSPPVYSHTAFLDDFFWRSFPYTQAEATPVLRTCGESSPLSPRDRSCVLKSAQASSGVCQTLVVCERSHRQMKGKEMLWRQASNLFYRKWGV